MRHFTEKTAVMAYFVQSRVPFERPKKSHLSCHARRNFPSLHSGRREGIRRKGKRERNWGERVGDACFKNSLLFISADAGVRKFQIGWAMMSNLLACTLACIIMRDKHDAGIKQMCSSGISFGRSKLLQSCSNLTLKSELEPAVTACLAGRDAQEVLYTGFVQTPSGNSRRLRFLPNICNADIHKTAFSAKTLHKYRHEWTSNGL